MKFEDLNSKAQEAFANSLIEVGVSLFKGAMFTVFVLPITLIIKAGLEGKASGPITPQQVFGVMDGTTYLTLISFLIGAIVMGIWSRREGLKRLNQINET